MIVSQSAITHLASEGYLTLLVPDLYIGSSSSPNDLVEYNDDLFIKLDYNNNICLGKKHGGLFLSEKGFNFFKKDLKKAFSNKRGFTWKDFEKHAKEHFLLVKNNHNKLINKLQKDLQYLQNIKL